MNKRILFLGYGKDQTSLPEWIEQFGSVQVTNDRVDTLSGYDSVIVYGYRHILSAALLATNPKPPVNLHISFLPFNRGAHPNFWCWIERTPAGVTVHEIDEGIDTGPIIQQRRFDLNDDEATFEEIYWELRSLAEKTLIEAFPRIITGNYEKFPQKGNGTFHKSSQLPAWVSWKMKIRDAQAIFEKENGR